MGDILQGASLMYPPEVQGGGGGFDLIIGGNTSGATASVSSGTLTLAGGNNITLSQNGNAISIIGPSPSGFSAGISGGNTSGNTGTVSNQFVLAGGNNIVLSGSTNAGGMTVTISGSNQSVQTQNLFDLTLAGNTSGALALVSSGTLTLAGGNNITLSQAGNAITISAASQSVQTQNLFDLTLAGNTSGTLALVSSGTLTLAGGNNIVLSQVGNAVTISASNQSVQTQNLFDLTLAGNTTGTLALVSSGTLTLAGGNNITLSQVGNAITISAFNQSVQSQNLFDLTLAGNTTGTLALVSSGTLTLAGGNNIVLSQNGNAITISASNQSVQTQNLHDVTLAGNTAGALALVSSGTMTLAGGNNITLSQNGNAITISGGAQTLSHALLVQPWAAGNNRPASNGTQTFWPFSFQGYVSASAAQFAVSMSLSTSATNNSTVSGGVSVYLGAYTRNSNTLTLVSSGSSAYTWSFVSNNSTAQLSNAKLLTIPINLNITPGDYWWGAAISFTTGGNLGQTFSYLCWNLASLPIAGANFGGYFLSTGVSSNQAMLGIGQATLTTPSLLASVAFNGISNVGSAPWVYIFNTTF